MNSIVSCNWKLPCLCQHSARLQLSGDWEDRLLYVYVSFNILITPSIPAVPLIHASQRGTVPRPGIFGIAFVIILFVLPQKHPALWQARTISHKESFLSFFNHLITFCSPYWIGTHMLTHTKIARQFIQW